MCNAMHAVNSIGRPQIRFKRILSYRIIVILTFLFIGLISSANAQIEWTPEAQISINDLYDDILPRLAASPDGSVWAVWIGSDGFDNEAYYSVYRDDEWSLPQRINQDDSWQQGNVDIAIEADGTPWAAIETNDPDGRRLFYCHWNDSDWGEMLPVFPDIVDAPYYLHRITVDASNTPLIIWAVEREGGGGSELFYSIFIDDQWSLPQSVEVDGGQGWSRGYNIVSGSDGITYCTWLKWLGPPTYENVPMISCWSGGSWSYPDTIPFDIDAHLRFDLDLNGKPWITWASGGDIWVSNNDGSEWKSPVVISAPDIYGDGWPDITCNNIGNPIVAWSSSDHIDEASLSDISINAFRDGEWGNEYQVNTHDLYSNYTPNIVTSNNNVVFIAWSAYDGTDDEIYYSKSMILESEIYSYNNLRKIIIYPNPIDKLFNIYLSNCRLNRFNKSIIELYNLKGQRLYRNTGKIDQKYDCIIIDNIPINILNPGCYYLQVFLDNTIKEGGVVLIR